MPSAPIQPEQLLGGTRAPAEAALSPDGKILVFAVAAGRDRHLFTMPASPAAGGMPVQITRSRRARSVVPLRSEPILNRLRNENKFADAKICENPDHGGIGHGAMTRENSLDALKRRLAFLDRHLKGDGQLMDSE